MFSNFLSVLPRLFRLLGCLQFLLIVVLLLIRCQSATPNVSESEVSYTDYEFFKLGFTITLPSKWSIFEKIDHINIANMSDILVVPEDIQKEYTDDFVGSIYLSSVEDVIQIYTNMYERISNKEPIQTINTLGLHDFSLMSTLFTNDEFNSLVQQYNITFDILLTIDSEYLYYGNTIMIFAKHIDAQQHAFLALRALNDTQIVVCVFNIVSKFIDENWIFQWVKSVSTIQLIK